ncbi:hypothetical protein ACVIHF_000551 [Bradyrhizobium sp. USDA 4506]
MQTLIGDIIERLVLDKGYRGHNAPPEYKFRVFIPGQKRRVTPKIKRELRRRSAVEPIIGHLKSERRMGRNYLWHRQGDATNAILAAAGYNFCRLLRWLELLLRQIFAQLIIRLQLGPSSNPCSSRTTTELRGSSVSAIGPEREVAYTPGQFCDSGSKR